MSKLKLNVGFNIVIIQIQNRPVTKMPNADVLKQLPLPETPSLVPIPEDIKLSLDHLSDNVVTAFQF